MAAKNPAKNPAKRTGKVPCGVCLAPVIDGKDEALLCEGECGLWLHRGCASIPPSRYKSLSTSDEPFVCLSCSNSQLKKELAQLKAEFKAVLELHTNGVHRQQIADLSDTVAALKMEVTQLKETLSTVSSDLTSIRSSRSSNEKPTYASKAAARRPARRTGSVHHHAAATNEGESGVRGTSRQVEPSTTTQSTTTRSSTERGERIPVPGVRRIWGTLRNTPPAAVTATLNKLTTLGNQLSVRRKTNDISGRSRWWFLVKGKEEVLALLEGEWERVSLQTNWKLESCTKPKTADDKPNPSDSSSESSLTTDTSGGEKPSLQPLPSEEIADGPPPVTQEIDTETSQGTD